MKQEKHVFLGNMCCELMRLFQNKNIYICMVLYIVVIKIILSTEIGRGSYWTAQQAILEISASSNLNKLLVFVAAFPMAASYCDDISNKYMEQIILRGSVMRYILSKVVMYAVVSFMISFAGLMLYAGYLGMRYGVGAYNYVRGNVFYDYAVSAVPFMAVTAHIFLFVLVSSAYAVLGLAVSSMAKGRFVAVTAPIFVNTFAEAFLSKLPKAVNLLAIQYGNNAYKLGTTGTLVMSLMVVSGYMLIGGLIFAHQVKRRAASEII